MKIHFIGTSHGAPEKGRKCTAMLLETGGKYYTIDCGTPVEEYARNMDIGYSSLSSVFITHMHADHCGCLSGLMKTFTVYSDISGGERTVCLPEQAGIDAYIQWHNVQLSQWSMEGKAKLQKSGEGVFYEDENVRVSGIKTDHKPGADTYSYVFEAEGKRVLFTGDLASDMHDYPKIVTEEHFDAVISELTHFDVNASIELYLKTKTDKLIFGHIFPGNEQRINRYEFPFPVYIANDNDIFEI